MYLLLDRKRGQELVIHRNITVIFPRKLLNLWGDLESNEYFFSVLTIEIFWLELAYGKENW